MQTEPLSGQGFTYAELLMPADSVDYHKWAVVACDQFTSQPGYWKQVSKLVGAAPSSLHIVLPEIYLEDDDVSERIHHMKTVMTDYLKDGILVPLKSGLVLTERHIRGRIRKGILLNIDLECYDYDISKKPVVRATESTVLSRIPPRVEIRRGAAIESPHIMLMMDDPEDEIIGSLHMQRGSFEKLYDFDLMMDGGRIEGWFTDNEKVLEKTRGLIEKLPRHDNMLFCVGDGNHSLATAKTIWEEAKKELSPEERQTSPLRYALTEVINLRDRAVEFMPIHRVLFNVNPANCAQYVTDKLNEAGKAARLVFGRWHKETAAENGAFAIPFLYKDGAGKIIIEKPSHPLAVGEVQDILEEYVAQNAQRSIDYIHGDDAFSALSEEYDCIGFYFDALEKSEFFDLIIRCGALPKKTFSLGEAQEKRYYLECRQLRQP
ncbi:MAG: DUF1015 domain-containing protein [Christensenellaceae bacterium]|jgi:hypothetical protein